jgi:hypothetical protein
MSSSNKSRKSSLRTGSSTTQKKQVRHSSKSPERLVFEKEFEEGDKPLLWAMHSKKLDDIVYEDLQDDFDKEYNKDKEHPFKIKSKTDIDKMSPSTKTRYEEQYKDYKTNLDAYMTENAIKKRNDIVKNEQRRRAHKQSHYLKIKRVDKIPLLPIKSRRHSVVIKPKAFPEKSSDPQNAINVRKSEPVPRKYEPKAKDIVMNIRNEKKSTPKKEGTFSGVVKSIRSFFSGNKTVGGRRRQPGTRKR